MPSKHTAEMFKNANGVVLTGGTYSNVGGGIFNVSGDVDPAQLKAMQDVIALARANGPDQIASAFEGFSGTLGGAGLNFNNSAGGIFTIKSPAKPAPAPANQLDSEKQTGTK